MRLRAEGRRMRECRVFIQGTGGEAAGLPLLRDRLLRAALLLRDPAAGAVLLEVLPPPHLVVGGEALVRGELPEGLRALPHVVVAAGEIRSVLEGAAGGVVGVAAATAGDDVVDGVAEVAALEIGAGRDVANLPVGTTWSGWRGWRSSWRRGVLTSGGR